MKITKYNLEVCKVCYRLKGKVAEEQNGVVPVFCMCDVRNNKVGSFNPRMQGGVITNGSVLLRFMPCSDYKRDDGEVRHVPHFAGMGWGCGNPDHLNKLLEFVKEHNTPKIESPPIEEKVIAPEIANRFTLWFNSIIKILHTIFKNFKCSN
jgi:hypothetical protein